MESKYDYVVFDIETTGLHPESDQICEIAAIGVKDGLPQGLFSTLVAIEGSMPEAAGRVNGITDDMLKGAPAIGDALDAFLDKWVREMYGWKNVRPSDVVIAKETCAEGIYYRVRKTVGNGDFFSVTSFGKR